MIALLAAAALARPCTPLPPSLPEEIADCIETAADGGKRVKRAAIGRLSFREGPPVVSVGKELYWVEGSGRAVPALPFDNGADDFVEGRARTIRDGKVGFVDRGLRPVISPRWDYAFPFEGGVAVVCEGCRTSEKGEHRRIEGGKWGYIDRTGRVVVPVVHAKEDLPSAEDGRRAARRR